MAVKIRLKRMGKIRQPYFRIVVVDSRKKRDGRVIEEIGKYHPKEEPSFIEVDSERAQYWLGVGAQPTEALQAILKITGDWQKFKGLPGAEGTLKVAEPKRDRTELFNEALKDAAKEPKGEAVTAKKAEQKAGKKTAKKAAPKDGDKAEDEAEAPAAAEVSDRADAPAEEPLDQPADESAVTSEVAAADDVAEAEESGA